MSQRAIIVSDRPTELESRLASILGFFDIPVETATTADLWSPAAPDVKGRYCVLSTMRSMGEALVQQPIAAKLPPLLERAESAFFFAGDQSEAVSMLLRAMTQNPSTELRETGHKNIVCSVSSKRQDVCGPLSGMAVSVPLRQPELAMTGVNQGGDVDYLLSSKEGCFFAAVRLGGLECFVTSCTSLVDLDSPVEGEYFDVAECFLSAVPLVMYLKHAFRGKLFNPVENGACLIIDDPVLRPHYGFVDFHRLAVLAVERRFACSIGFIPWNWRRSRPTVVELFKRHPERLSLTVHGCDHSGGEFGDQNSNAINARVKGALSRMEGHRRLTGLQHESVMVFPQGVFSAGSPPVLKHNGFAAAVNTKVSPVGAGARTEIREIWRLAIMKYGDFAVYTRRYAFHGIHNFAFDLLLGKPCLIASHHDDFEHEGRELLDFIDRLNNLQVSLTWRPVGEVVRRAYGQRMGEDDTFEARMYGSEIVIENPDPAPRWYVVERQERAPEGIERVEVGGKVVGFAADKRICRFQMNVGPRESVTAKVCFHDTFGDARYSPPMGHQIRLLARRCLCEFRDESHAKAPWVYYCAQGMRRLVAGPPNPVVERRRRSGY